MASRQLTNTRTNQILKSFKRSSELLKVIYEKEAAWSEHDLQRYSIEAHEAKDKLIEELDRFMSFRLDEPASPPPLKHRKNAANWRDPNNRSRGSTRKRSRVNSVWA